MPSKTSPHSSAPALTHQPPVVGARGVIALLGLVLCQCQGNLVGEGLPEGSAPIAPPGSSGNGKGDDGAAVIAESGFQPVAGALRKLTVAQYTNSVRDILGSEITVPENLEPDTTVNGYAAIAAAQQTISPSAADKLETAAYDIAAQAMQNPLRSRLVTCTPAAAADEACARQTLSALGARAFRRALTDAELGRYVGVATSAATTLGDFYQGMEFGIAALLQSLPFLYRVELGEPDPANPKLRRFNSSELASRLSYLIWNSTPDAELLSKVAASKELSTEELATQAARLLASPRAQEGVKTFHAERFGLDHLHELVKDQEKFPEATPALAHAMQQEVHELVRHLVFEQKGDYRQLLTTRETFVNGALAELYGLPAAGNTFTKASFPAGTARSGLLTTAAFLASHAGAVESSPSKRGKFVREAILCQSIPLPPPDIVTILPPDPSKRTMREKLTAHVVEPSCAGCHLMMDPIGLAFEHFDALGVYRETHDGAPLDVTGDLDGAAFADARGLTELIASSPTATACVVRNLYRYATGHVETTGEEPAITKLTAAFEASGHRFDELIKALVASPELRYAATPQE